MILFISDTLKKNQNNMIFKSILIIFTATIFTGIFSSDVLAAEGPEVRGNPNRLAKIKIADTGQFDGNRIRNDLENNGMIVSHRITGHSGMEWPKDSNLHINFASGIWIAGLVNGDLRIAVSEYGPEFVPGPYGSDPDDPAYRIYKLSYLNPYSEDYTEWPVEQGAPWIDANGDGIYNVADGDKPDMLGDQMLWYVMNDGDTEQHSIFNTQPLNIEVQMTIWGYDQINAAGDMMFVKSLIINKGADTIDSTFIALWSDPDLGNAGDDFVGCDTTLSLGFCYNDGADHDYGDAPPAIGYDLFQGPMVEAPGETAWMFGNYWQDRKNLGMTAFPPMLKNIAGPFTSPNNREDVYNLLQGKGKDGYVLTNPITGQPTVFAFTGNPESNVDDQDSIWVDSDQYRSADRRFLMSSGPFTMAPGDSQEVVFGIIIAQGTDALNSVTVLKEVDVMAQSAFDLGFKTPKPEPISNVVATALEDAIVLNWDDGINAVEQFTEVALFEKDSLGQKTWFQFQGYNVYQLETASGQGEIKRLATYDIVDGVTEIWDDIYDPDYGSVVNVRVQYGSDSGVKRSIVINGDALRNDIPLKLNRAYYFTVTAYGYNPNGEPKTVESEMNIIEVRPQISTTQVANEDIEPGVAYIRAAHTSGKSDGSVRVVVIDPFAVTGHDYEVYFRHNADSSAVLWYLIDATENKTVLSGSPIQGGVDMATGEEIGVNASPIADGIQVQVTGPPRDLKWIGVTENASGALDSPVDALAYWYFPSYVIASRDYAGQQSTTDAIWFFNVGPMYGFDQDAFLDSVFMYTGGINAPGGPGIQWLIPDDFEVRFTGNGKAINYWGDSSIVDVPFEWWNIAVADDPSDDFKLIPYLRDEDDNGEWNLQYGREDADHPTSGGLNDPWTDRVYVLSPVDETPGTQGFENFIAGAESGEELPAWYSQPGWTDPGGSMDAWCLFAHTVFMIWNGGDVTSATSPADYSAESPEIGTVFRITTANPNSVNDVFSFSTDSLKPETVAYSPESIKVWPNPYFAYNPEERTPFERKVMFTHLPGIATIRIFNLAGELVRIIRHTDGTQFETWDLTNMVGRSVGSGMYIVYIETEFGAMVLKLAVIQPQERLHIY